MRYRNKAPSRFGNQFIFPYGLAFLIIIAVGVGSAWADSPTTECESIKIFVSRDQVRALDENKTKEMVERHIIGYDSNVFYPDIDENFVIKCFKNAAAVMYLKQDVDAQHRGIKITKTKDYNRYIQYSTFIIILSATSTFLLSLQKLVPQEKKFGLLVTQVFSYSALGCTAAVTVLSGLNQLYNPRETFNRDLNTEYSLATLQSDIGNALIDAASGQYTAGYEIPHITLTSWREREAKALGNAGAIKGGGEPPTQPNPTQQNAPQSNANASGVK